MNQLNVTELAGRVSWCLESSQPQRVTSGLTDGGEIALTATGKGNSDKMART